ncbi:hypothetical protein P9112_006601 [Eukaryota sp. TZLM1-RC]
MSLPHTEKGKPAPIRDEPSSSVTLPPMSSSRIRRSIVRFVTIVIDCSSAALLNDIRPNRLEVFRSSLTTFISPFLSENALSQICLIAIKDGKAIKITDFTSNTSVLSSAISSKQLDVGMGNFSLQNGLSLSAELLQPLPTYASKEVLVLCSSISTVDPSDLLTTAKQLAESSIRVFMFSLGASVFAFEKVCSDTKGRFEVIQSVNQLPKLLSELITPPPSLTSSINHIMIGFPSRKEPTFCQNSISSPLQLVSYECPQCVSKVPSIPSICPVCSLHLVASSNLLHANHHLYGGREFVESMVGDGEECSGCGMGLMGAFKCKECESNFCLKCKDFIVTQLFNCPDCSTLKN